MNYLKKTLLFATLTILVSCQKDQYWAIRGKGDVTTQNKQLDGFDAIQLSCSADVIYTQDSVFLVEVSAQPNIMQALKIEVKEKELCIDYKKQVWDHKGIKITVHSPAMRGMSVSGSGNIVSTGNINSRNMCIHVSGSGNVTIPTLYGESLQAKISGSGNAEILGGQIGGSDYSISGSGNINTEFMPTSNNTSKVSGSGNVRLQATENLTVRISGSGDLYYRGTPAMDVDVSGSGKIRKI